MLDEHFYYYKKSASFHYIAYKSSINQNLSFSGFPFKKTKKFPPLFCTHNADQNINLSITIFLIYQSKSSPFRWQWSPNHRPPSAKHISDVRWSANLLLSKTVSHYLPVFSPSVHQDPPFLSTYSISHYLTLSDQLSLPPSINIILILQSTHISTFISEQISS